MGFGESLKDGTLPVYSVGDAAEARELLVLACPTNINGQFVARELLEAQTLENLQAFSDRLDRAHELLKKNGQCRCEQPVENSSRSG